MVAFLFGRLVGYDDDVSIIIRRARDSMDYYYDLNGDDDDGSSRGDLYVGSASGVRPGGSWDNTIVDYGYGCVLLITGRRVHQS